MSIRKVTATPRQKELHSVTTPNSTSPENKRSATQCEQKKASVHINNDTALSSQNAEHSILYQSTVGQYTCYIVEWYAYELKHDAIDWQIIYCNSLLSNMLNN